MPSKPRNKESEKEKEPETPKSRAKSHHRSSRPRKVDRAATPPERGSTNPSPSTIKRRASMPVPELERQGSSASPLGSKTSLPYPSFSKEHSKEAVGSRDNVVNPRLSYYTPEPTDLDKEKGEGLGVGIQNAAGVTPPSPPETTVDQEVRVEKPKAEKSKVKKARVESPHQGGSEEDKKPAAKIRVRKSTLDVSKHVSSEFAKSRAGKSELEKGRSEKPKADTVKVERKSTDLQKAAEFLSRKLRRASSEASDKVKERPSPPPRSRNSLREARKDDGTSTPLEIRSKPGTPSKLRPKQATVEDHTSSTASVRKSTSSDPNTSLRKSASSDLSSLPKSETTNASTTDSGATERPSTPHVDRNSSPATDPDSSPRTRTIAEPQFPPSGKATPYFALGDNELSGTLVESPLPPPPPPPPEVPMPKVDYLMQNGGLPHSVPKRLLAAGQPSQGTQPTATMATQFFSPIHKLLEDYDKVISRNGSLAVATGYRSVARRLLDRLEAVFARDISSETCTCVLCQASDDFDASPDDKRGVSWGEIFEYVSAREELPQWPAFVMDATQTGLCISASERIPPMQKLDVDVPEEFRDHYVRQSKKTQQSVDKWLDSQPQNPSSPPSDVDDETLTFAMLTRLEPEQRPVFSSLVGVVPSRPNSTAGAPLISPTSNLLQNTGLAIQRLYRLPNAPRDPESAMYLLTNPHLHNVLATLAAISDGEWEILISGRFDGFLRSGADDVFTATPPSRDPSRGPTPSLPASRGPTPFSRNPTPAPASVGAPITIDEENEIAALAEVEREIFLSMEALEG